jgi:hypothetical protein
MEIIKMIVESYVWSNDGALAEIAYNKWLKLTLKGASHGMYDDAGTGWELKHVVHVGEGIILHYLKQIDEE